MLLTIAVIGGTAYALYKKNRNPYWTPLSTLFATPHELREALQHVRVTSVPTPTPAAALDPGMSPDQAQAVNAVLVTETDEKKLADHAEAAKSAGLSNSGKAIEAKANAVANAKAKGASETDIKKEQVAAAVSSTAPTTTGWGGYQTSGPADCGPTAYWDEASQRCVPLALPAPTGGPAPACPPGTFFDYFKQTCTPVATHAAGWEPWGRDHFGHGERQYGHHGGEMGGRREFGREFGHHGHEGFGRHGFGREFGHHGFGREGFSRGHEPFEHDRMREHRRRFGGGGMEAMMQGQQGDAQNLPICTPHDIALGRAGTGCQMPQTDVTSGWWGHREPFFHRHWHRPWEMVAPPPPIVMPSVAEVVDQPIVTGAHWGHGFGGWGHHGWHPSYWHRPWEAELLPPPVLPEVIDPGAVIAGAGAHGGGGAAHGGGGAAPHGGAAPAGGGHGFGGGHGGFGGHFGHFGRDRDWGFFDGGLDVEVVDPAFLAPEFAVDDDDVDGMPIMPEVEVLQAPVFGGGYPFHSFHGFRGAHR